MPPSRTETQEELVEKLVQLAARQINGEVVASESPGGEHDIHDEHPAGRLMK